MIDAIKRELLLEQENWTDDIHTIYFGGGTPSLLSADELEDILSTIYRHFNVADDVEVTLEANPDDLTHEKVKALRGISIDRMSLGVQSFHEKDLSYMDRAHNAREAKRAIEWVMEAGFSSVSADLIYGLPSLTDSAWEENLETLMHLDVPHLSCYQLTIESGTPLQAFIDRGSSPIPDDEMTVRQMEILLDKCAEYGYEDYEISNYARPGHRSKHNSAYWTGLPYLGIGPSAHSYDGERRWWNTVVNRRYIEEVDEGKLTRTYDVLTEQTRFNEYVLTQLRRKEGFDTQFMKASWPDMLTEAMPTLERYTAEGWLEHTERGYTLTRAGKHWSDRISMELMVV